MIEPDDEMLSELAPHQVLRVALNHGNFLLVGRDEYRKPVGISVELARDLAEHVGLSFEFIEFERAVDVASSAMDDVWDVCFLAVDPKRSETIAFTKPYVCIDGSYLAGPGCLAETAHELVASGATVGSVSGSAYTLKLARLPGSENVRPLENMKTAVEYLRSGRVDAIAGIRQAMMHEAEAVPGARVLQPPFMEIRQAMGTPHGRSLAISVVSDFLANAIGSGRVGDILERHGVSRDCVPG
ncbi:amino acid ABC transporter substrate-binding protein, PAAT family [Roseovarius pacificus]|uniref:Amino acid ABC transporter substrate-binding protein, PAAT family n=1 Tax=Roseovarius pacificus TaxID=337701 RepID=A0A1M7A3V4_9RHOB|nr:transporter substrate-binding domain-containing protein [Roseovarius pacificus]GGO53923.1 ABC transporter substrate-binding protein [Roseovarius pacificus]SHL37340.1 amino acid ABC transporter substrate-binding protein, PAAT family [Roseovarius pacificus]